MRGGHFFQTGMRKRKHKLGQMKQLKQIAPFDRAYDSSFAPSLKEIPPGGALPTIKVVGMDLS